MDLVLNHNQEIKQACYQANITTSKNIGMEEGAISILSNGRMDRKQYIKIAIMNTLMYLENSTLY